MLEWIRSWIEKRRLERRKIRSLRTCGNYCLCPRCGDVLNDQAECTDTDLVRYVCGCGHRSAFNFDVCPFPLLIEEGDEQCLNGG